MEIGGNLKYLKMFFKAQAFARDVRDCPICELLIELGDHIFGVYINGQGHQWDCKGRQVQIYYPNAQWKEN